MNCQTQASAGSIISILVILMQSGFFATCVYALEIAIRNRWLYLISQLSSSRGCQKYLCLAIHDIYTT